MIKNNLLRTLYALAAISAVSLSSTACHKADVTDYINPMIGASTSRSAGKSSHGLGKTFPGPTTPFGLVQLSPDTMTGGDNGPGYSWHHNTIEGFSFLHMSGIGWYGEFGNFLVIPNTGRLKTYVGTEEYPDTGYRSRFSHDSEVCRLGYYAVTLDDYDVRTELTAAPHAGFIRMTFPQTDTARISIDLARRIGGSSSLQHVTVVDKNTIQGWMDCSSKDGGWGAGAGNVNYTVFFYCQFSEPLEQYGVWSAELPEEMSFVKLETLKQQDYINAVTHPRILYGQDEYEGRHLGFFTEFAVKEARKVVNMKVGISFVSVEGAKNNLEHDISHWDFDRTCRENKKRWKDALEGIRVKGSERDKMILYTALYHTMIDPRIASDVDGCFIGADGRKHRTEDFQYRTIFSGWDVFRSQFPLQTIINPKMVNDEINSLIHIARSSSRKYFPRWEIMNSYSGCMIGNPAVSVMVDAYNKGIRNWDVEEGFEYALNTVETFGNDPLGFTPNDISRTLEYCYSDWCIHSFAKALDKKEIASIYKQKSLNYKNIWDDDIKWFRGRQRDSTFAPWLGELKQSHYCIESNPLQQGWFVPHDVYGLIDLLGKDAFVEKLTAFFDNSSEDFLWNNFYNHPNEPVHHVPFLFAYSGNAYLTQKWTRRICANAYGTDVLGLCGNEDVGQMSAWYVLSSFGFHPVAPGSNVFILTSPVFDEINIKLDKEYHTGKYFKVRAYNNSDQNIYINSARLNGQPLDRAWITYEEIVNGGVLELDMGDKPNKDFGRSNLPPRAMD